MYSERYGMPDPLAPFEQHYRCYSASFIDKPHLEIGDKVMMPLSAFDRLVFLRIDYPMLFEVHNPSKLCTSHCGVLEFVAEEGTIYMPNWMMQNMLLEEGDIVRVKSATLPKSSFMKLQPHTKEFMDISNPKIMLETTLRNFSCLTIGDNIMVAYGNNKYNINIIELKPANAISIIETDCEVDFAPPLDYKEPERVTPLPISGPPSSTQDATPLVEPGEPNFIAFMGTGRRIDGFTSSISQTSTTSTTSASSTQRSTRTPPAATQRPSGKLVYGGGNNNGEEPIAAIEVPTTKKEEVKEEKEPEGYKFQAFSGRKYSLRD